MFALYYDINVDPMSSKAMAFEVRFPEVYSTACIAEVAVCKHCSKVEDPECGSMVDNELAELAKVFINLNCVKLLIK